jgi:hypothetical protein
MTSRFDHTCFLGSEFVVDLLDGGAATLHRNRVGIRCSAEGLHLTPTVATREFGGSVSIGFGIAASAAFLSSYDQYYEQILSLFAK